MTRLINETFPSSALPAPAETLAMGPLIRAGHRVAFAIAAEWSIGSVHQAGRLDDDLRRRGRYPPLGHRTWREGGRLASGARHSALPILREGDWAV